MSQKDKTPMAYVPEVLRDIMRKWTNLALRTKGLIAFIIPAVTLLVAGALFIRMDLEKADTDERIKRAFEARAQLQNIYIVLISAESEVRNYGLNGREDGLQPFGLTRATVDAVFAKIRDQIAEDADQVTHLAQIQQLVYTRIDGLRNLREYYHAAGDRRTAAPADLETRARISPDILLAFNELATSESKRIQDRIKSGLARQARLRTAILTGVALSFFGAILAVVLFCRAITRRVQKLERNASRLAEGLPSDAHWPETDELGHLATAIEKAGEVIAARSDELKLALEGAELLIWDLEPDSGRIRYHAGIEKLHSGFHAALLPETVEAWIAMVHADDREHVHRELNRITSENGTLQIEYRVVMRGGGIRWMMVKAQSYVLATGERRLLGVLSDITVRQSASTEIANQAEQLANSREALQTQTRILQSILDSMGDGVVVANREGKFLVFNPAARQLLGVVRSFGADTDEWARHHGLFLPDKVTLYPSDQLPFVRAIRGQSVDATEIFVRPAGVAEGTWISVTARPLRDESGDISGGVLVIRDVTASKRAAEALELAVCEAETANQAKSEFLSRMSHELRTPLNSILGFAQLLELGSLDEQASDNVHHILKGGYHLLELINEILDLARIESGRIALSPEPVLMREALQDALDLVRPLAIEKSVNISAGIALRCEHHVHADRQRLKQVLLNLLSNAIKFNRSGGSVVLSCEETNDRRLRMEVIDTGAGISPEGLKKIFRPFERLDLDGTSPGGTGLGLALSKRLVEAMGGTIGVESAVGFGSRFFVELAILEDPASSLDRDDSAVTLIDAGAMHQRGTVLYVEDNSSNLRLVERIFVRRPNVRLLSAMNGSLGLDLADLHTPDWILLDLHLPDISGEDVLLRLRANPRTARIPITILSADATPGQISRLMTAGARDYLTKPLDVRKFIHLLDKTISGGDLQQTERVYAERNYQK